MLGGFGKDGLADARFGARVNGNHEKTLNLDCTLRHLMDHPQGSRILAELLQERPGGGAGAPQAALGVITLRDSLQYMGKSAEEIRALEEKLHAIANREGEE